MRYPITKLLEAYGQWWYVNAVFNEPPKERNRMVLDPANGVALQTITADMLHRAWDEFDYRVDVCRVTQGAHIEGL
jgi:hypothetical protein